MPRPSMLSHVLEGAFDDTDSHRQAVKSWAVPNDLEIRLPNLQMEVLGEAGYMYAHVIRALRTLEKGEEWIAAVVRRNPWSKYAHELVKEWQGDRQFVYDEIYCPFWEKYEDVKDLWVIEQRRGTLPRATMEFNEFLETKIPVWKSVEKRMMDLRLSQLHVLLR